MISPDKIVDKAKEMEDENYAFRTFLKINADSDELDEKFKRLHEELFADYDCSKCRNCCKKYCGVIPDSDIDKDADYLGLSRKQFVSKFLVWEESEVSYKTQNCPCDFLKDNECILNENMPESCKKYPFTDQPDRMGSLLSILTSVGVCPVVFEIFERLKQEYHFDKKNDSCPCGSGKKYKKCCGR